MTTLYQPARRQTVLKTAGVAPISLAEAKDQLDIVDDASQDAYIDGLIAAATEFVGEWTSRAITESTWRLLIDRFPDCSDTFSDRILLPKGNLRSVTSLKYWSAAGVSTTWDSSNYAVDVDSEPGAVVLADGISWPSTELRAFNGVEIEFVAGWDAPAATEVKGQIPATIRQAILLLVRHWFDNRSAVVIGNTSAAVSRPMEFAVDALTFNKRLSFA